MFDETYVARALDELTLPFGDGNPGVMAYHRVFVRRYANTLSQLTDLPPELSALELAANPYGMTGILKKELFHDLQLASYGSLGSHEVIQIGLGNQSFSFLEKKFNVEQDIWPYADQSLDLIVCCEMLEHLAMDPMHVFFQANRVLRTGGRFFVSTPNASSFQNVLKLLKFQAQSLAPHYRGPANFEGIYQRHNRELTPLALTAMFRAAGFDLDFVTTTNSYPLNTFDIPEEVLSSLRAVFGDKNRGDTMNFMGIKSSPPQVRYPLEEELYIASDPR